MNSLPHLHTHRYFTDFVKLLAPNFTLHCGQTYVPKVKINGTMASRSVQNNTRKNNDVPKPNKTNEKKQMQANETKKNCTKTIIYIIMTPIKLRMF